MSTTTTATSPPRRDDIVRRALDGRHPELVEPMLPPDGWAFLQKVRHSAFYSTLLTTCCAAGDQGIILTGQVTEQCILYSALDAYVRHFEVACPPTRSPISIRPRQRRAGDDGRNMRAEILSASTALSRA